VAVALVTATGLKDPGVGVGAEDVPVIQPTLDSLQAALRDRYQFSPS
jgi:hypothetical protein